MDGALSAVLRPLMPPAAPQCGDGNPWQVPPSLSPCPAPSTKAHTFIKV